MNMKPVDETKEVVGFAFSALIRGRVQGVGFRYSAIHEARRLGLSGWVRNRSDGAVEVWSEGPPEKQTSFLKWLHRGPPSARVDSLRYEPRRPTGKYSNFSIQF
ncbi:MAG: acylphosphatase [Treponema sp.]|jgi:acylphosphatase|nr:acylphosphatase [Treponema sp.]